MPVHALVPEPIQRPTLQRSCQEYRDTPRHGCTDKRVCGETELASGEETAVEKDDG